MTRAVVVFESLARVANVDWLYKTLERAGLDRHHITTTAVVLEEVKDVKRRHLTAGREPLREMIDPGDVVLLVGNTPLEAITDKKGIKQRRGRPFEQDSVLYLPIMPPGVVLYDDKQRPMMEADLRLFADMVSKGAIPREEGLSHVVVDSNELFDAMLLDLEGTVSFDIETGTFDEDGRYLDGALYPWVKGGRVVSVGFGTRKRQWCLPLCHPESPWPREHHRELLMAIDAKLRHCYLVAHNGKFDSLWLKVHYGVDWRCDFDTMLGHYMLDENARHGLKLLAQVYYGAPNYDADLDTKSGAGPLDKHCLYLAHDVYYTRKLRFTLQRELDKDDGVKRVFEQLLMPVASLFVDIELHGVKIDVDRFEEAEVYLRDQLKQAERDLRKAILRQLPGYDVNALNWNSPKQVAKLFFTDLGLKVLDKTKGGAPSTNESVLLRIDHPVAAALIKRRGADQLLKMFIEGWKPFLDDVGRLHPSFKLHGTVTGRPSCEHPNLQQVPRDSLIRSLVVEDDGWMVIEIDLSQIEMRIAAELSGDSTLLGLFDRGEDVHWMTAMREISRGGGMKDEILGTAEKYVKRKVSYAEAVKIVYDMGPDKAAELLPAWKELRKKAKAVNFGYLFGMWWKKFKIYARDNYGVYVTDKQAQDSRKFFFDTYRELAPWHERQRRYARRHGYVRSLSGALRRLPRAQDSRDTPERAEAWRQAINSPVQRFACELNLMVLLQLKAEFPHIRPMGTIHDAVLFGCQVKHVPTVYRRALEVMKRPKMLDEWGIKLRVPVMGEAKIGPWSKGVSLEKWMSQQKEGHSG